MDRGTVTGVTQDRSAAQTAGPGVVSSTTNSRLDMEVPAGVAAAAVATTGYIAYDRLARVNRHVVASPPRTAPIQPYCWGHALR